MSIPPLHTWTAREIAAAVNRREVSAVEVVGAHLERIAAMEAPEAAPSRGGGGAASASSQDATAGSAGSVSPSTSAAPADPVLLAASAPSDSAPSVDSVPPLHAWLEVFAEAALAEAAALDRRLAEALPERPLPLAGVPVAVKDNLSQAGHALTAASRILQGYVAPFSATAVDRLRSAGALPLGRTNLDELGMGSSTETSCFGPTRNPWHRARVPGGSSGGSAAAVAAGAAALALGSDTGGSVRQPAAFCGVVGVRPTRGRVSRHGLMAFASSLDTVGPLARDVGDAARALTALSGADPLDAISEGRPVADLEIAAEALAGRLASGGSALRMGVVRELEVEGMELSARASWTAALEVLRRLGVDLVEVSVPALPSAVAAYHLLAAAEASTNLARLDGARYGRQVVPRGGATVDDLYRASRTDGFGAEVRRRVLLGTFALSAGHRDRYYERATALAARLRRQVAEALAVADVLVTPTAPTGAFALGARLDDPVAMYQSDLFTAPVSLAGLPAVAVPCGLDGDGLPLSLQVVGPPFGEAAALGVALAFELAVEWRVQPASAAPAFRVSPPAAGRQG